MSAMLIKVLLAYLLIVNITGFVMMAVDKNKARRGAWRTPEKSLFGIAIIGGSLGSLLGMYTFRHKTKHLSFVIGMPLILILQVLIGIMIFR